MPFDPSSLEAELRKLSPSAPDDSLLARLEGCAEATWAELDPMEIQRERRLRSFAPARLSPALMASLESAVRDTPFPGDVKIVAFPKQAPAQPATTRGWWSAAAAVAILGASAALLIPAGKSSAPAAANVQTSPRPAAATDRLVPAGFNRGLSEASDEGVIWSDKRPHRVLKVVYRDQVTLRDAEGKTYQVERPRVEYIIVPAKTD